MAARPDVTGAAANVSAMLKHTLNRVLRALPLGRVRAAGWLERQLQVQAEGLTGHLDEFWPSVSESAWKGGSGDAWERGPYYLDGLVPLAYLTGSERLQAKVRDWIEPILASRRADGWFGPTANQDRWPLAVALKALTQYHEATGDGRALDLVRGYFQYLQDAPPDWPDKEWRGVRAMENVVTAHWLHDRRGDDEALQVARSIHDNSFDWTRYFLEFPQKDPVTPETYQFRHWTHVVNVAMAIKYPGLWFAQAGDERDRRAVFEGIANLDRYHGQVGGRFSGDEHLSGRSPVQGTELCAIVEYMFSLEKLMEIFGEATLGERLEMLAYNGLPGTCTPDFWAHQYDQQANQVLCTVAKRRWSNNGDASNIFGLEPNFGCCTANMHQGWPKFVAHLWMQSPDGGLAATAYGPSTVTLPLGSGQTFALCETTDYPFDETIRLRVEASGPAPVPIHLRIPHWAAGATLSGPGIELKPAPGTFARVERAWRPGDELVLHLPMPLRVETRENNAAAILRGPIVFGLRIGENHVKIASHHERLPAHDWEIHPTTAWNYALALDRSSPERSLTLKRAVIPDAPFSPDAPPVVLQARARRVPSWGMADNSAAPTPVSPVASREPDEAVALVPYGSTRLRISEFPVLAAEPSNAP